MTTSADPADAIVAALAGAGTRLVFGVPGGGPNLDVVGAAAAAGLRFVLAHGETAATIMAATCADLTGAPGAVLVTRGPGLASAVNGIAHAALDRLPLVVIADTVPSAATRVIHQRIDQDALGRSVAKAAITVGGPRAAAYAARTALTAPRGPVVANMDESCADLDIPESRVTDVTQAQDGADAEAMVCEEAGACAEAGACEEAGTCEEAGARALGEALARARRPVIMLGTGAIPRTGAVRKALAGSGIPALHTYRARGVMPDSAAEAAGLVTGGTMEWPLLSTADLIVGLGVDEAEMIPAPWTYAARTIMVTEDEGHGYFTGATTLRMPLDEALDALAAGRGHDWPDEAGRAVRQDATRRLAELAVAAPGRLAPQQVVTTVRDGTPPETVATVDAGAHMLVAMPLWEVPEPGRLLISSGLATMGYALPAAISAALCLSETRGAPGVPVVAFTGDGGLGMTLAELETAVRLSLPVIVVVFNDAALSLIEIKQQPDGQGGAEAVRYRPVSFAAAAT
ncbi:MAG TPA: thiamine pyrophosphate-dependent enzyme, partial [Streptosporangiaceae bacterium]|nr:thiamine pyrophosphate-dependent enzyme [Streptosporangiaceae bacterium]